MSEDWAVARTGALIARMGISDTDPNVCATRNESKSMFGQIGDSELRIVLVSRTVFAPSYVSIRRNLSAQSAIARKQSG